MNGLSESQLQDLTAYIKLSLRRYNVLEEELVDHLACLVEEKMAEGCDYPTARQHALEIFNKDEVKSTEGRTLYFVHTKPVLMKCFLLLSVSGMTALLLWFVRPTSETDHVLTTTQSNLKKTAPMIVSGNADMTASLAVFSFSEEKLHMMQPKPKDPPILYPLSKTYEVSSGYGMRIHPISKQRVLHRGIDIRAPKGTPVVATADGIVEFAAREHNYGLKIVIRHDDEYTSLYAHLGEIKVKPGDQITKGTVIALVGSTGKSTAPHLHYEIRKDGKTVDPAEYLPRS
ncbi:MAG: M23 family metallopeptidase [Saprospiraceae bacterium]